MTDMDDKMGDQIDLNLEEIAPRRKVEFRFRSLQSQSVAVAGNFNNWNPSLGKMRLNPEGLWVLRLDLELGQYQYKFVFDNKHWEIDPKAPTIKSEHGYNNILIIT